VAFHLGDVLGVQRIVAFLMPAAEPFAIARDTRKLDADERRAVERTRRTRVAPR